MRCNTALMLCMQYICTEARSSYCPAQPIHRACTSRFKQQHNCAESSMFADTHPDTAPLPIYPHVSVGFWRGKFAALAQEEKSPPAAVNDGGDSSSSSHPSINQQHLCHISSIYMQASGGGKFAALAQKEKAPPAAADDGSDSSSGGSSSSGSGSGAGAGAAASGGLVSSG